jgi:hypothetical protein
MTGQCEPGKADLDAFWGRLRVSSNQNDTIAIGKFDDVPALKDKTLEGVSPDLRRRVADLDASYEADRIKSPNPQPPIRGMQRRRWSTMPMQMSAGLNPADLDGKMVDIHISKKTGVCSNCAAGLPENSRAKSYAGRKVLQIRNGKIINEFRAAALEFLHHAVGAVYDTRTRLVLAIAEVARKAIETDMAEQIRNALDLAGRWEQSSDVPGAALSNAVEGESGNDDNLAVEMGEAPELQKPAWVALASAILYTSWHAYLADSDKKVMTETVSEVNEEVIDEVVDYAGRVPGFDLRLVDRLAQHCLDHHRTSDASESIPREVMLQVATATD